MRLNVASLIEHSARSHPSHTAFVHGPRSMTYGALRDAVHSFAGALLAKGIREGDRVVLVLPNSFEFPITFYAVLYLGAVAVPVNGLLRTGELEHVLMDSDASLLVTTTSFSDAATAAVRAGVATIAWEERSQDADPSLADDQGVIESKPVLARIDRLPTEDAILLYTSGTTGKPKGVRLSHSAVMWITEVMAVRVFDMRPDDVVLGALPLSHIFGLLAVMNVSMLAASSVALMSRFEPEAALDALEDHSVTVFEGVPAMCSAMVNAADENRDLTGLLRLAFLGGQSSPIELLRAFGSRFACPIIECYGATETGSSIAATSAKDDPEEVVGTVGRPLWGVDIQLRSEDGQEVRPGEIGQVFVRSPANMTGYLNDADATREVMGDGYIATGDLGMVDMRGNLRIVDRIKDMIIRGGYNVYPREIEEVLYEHPAVLEAAVIGVPDPRLGEEIAAVVALRPGGESPSEDGLRSWIRDRVAAYKYPRLVRIVDEIPKNATGKISKKSIDREGLLVPSQQDGEGFERDQGIDHEKSD